MNTTIEKSTTASTPARIARRLVAALAFVVAALVATVVAVPAASADLVTNWGGRGSVQVWCEPYTHNLTTGVTITQDVDTIVQAVGYVRIIQRWNGSSWVDAHTDYYNFSAGSMPHYRTVKLSPGYYRVKISYSWAKDGVTRSIGAEYAPGYLQYGSTWQNNRQSWPVTGYCRV